MVFYLVNGMFFLMNALDALCAFTASPVYGLKAGLSCAVYASLFN